MKRLELERLDYQTVVLAQLQRRAERMSYESQSLLRQWFASLDSQLDAEASRAGLLGHPTMTGGAREDVLKNILQNILPPSTHVGSGRLIGSEGPPSKQVDIVVADGQFPILRMGNDAIYPIEGVIATIEVKSELDQRELRSALENSASVLRILPSFVKEDADHWMALRQAEGRSQERAIRELHGVVGPRTYLFAYKGFQSRDAQANAIQRCLPLDAVNRWGHHLIPSVIVGDSTVTIALGDHFGVTVPDPVGQAAIDERGIAITLESRHRVGILVSHLLWHIEERRLVTESPATVRRTVRGYLPFIEYINEVTQNQEFSVTVWNETET